jgi:hypothetical protein
MKKSLIAATIGVLVTVNREKDAQGRQNFRGATRPQQ